MTSITRVIFEVYGVYTHGKLAGKTNPKASALVHVYGKNFDDCKKKINQESDGAFWRVREVCDDANRLVFTGAYA